VYYDSDEEADEKKAQEEEVALLESTRDTVATGGCLAASHCIGFYLNNGLSHRQNLALFEPNSPDSA